MCINYVIIHEMIMKSAEIELKYINLYMFGNILNCACFMDLFGILSLDLQ